MELLHYGTPRHSGRYPWGSGKDPYQSDKPFHIIVRELKAKGLTESEIAAGLGILGRNGEPSPTALRAKARISRTETRKNDVALAIKLKESGMGDSAIGRQMGINESSVRSLLNPSTQVKADAVMNTANSLERLLKEKPYPYLEVGLGVEANMGVNRTTFTTALAVLEERGYKLNSIKVAQINSPGKFSRSIILSPGDKTYKEVLANRMNVQLVTDYSEDKGRTFLGIEPPKAVDSSRVAVRWGPDGGNDQDGLIELRRGVDDLSLGGARYAQVRINVDNTHYLKGMAVYSDDMPDGVDIIFNTNKSHKSDIHEAMKPLQDDPDNPFGSSVRQRHYTDSNGKTQLSALNLVGAGDKVNEEGAWGEWSKTLSSQMLSKQTADLARKQLALAYDSKQEEFDEIMAYTNPTIKRKLLESFADDADSAAVHLKAAAMPRQMTHVLIPVPSIKDGEVFAPNYKDGETVVLIRHPHGGIFEIPELTVNNKNPQAISRLGRDAIDAVGVSKATADKLSGADFDGDHVLVIPNNSGAIKTSAPIKSLANFDAKESYKDSGQMAELKATHGGKWPGKQLQMGNISNLITDMTIKGANEEEIAKAVRHSMVVIDAEKHELDFSKSARDNGISELKERYQGGKNRGASTLISKATSTAYIPSRVEGARIGEPNKRTGEPKRVYIDPNTGQKLYEYTGERIMYNKKAADGSITKVEGNLKTMKSTKLYEVADAFELSSGTKMEAIYAAHSNKLKALGNQARKATLNIADLPYSPSAKRTYANEVESLKSKLRLANSNKTLERVAHIIGGEIVSAKRASNPDMSGEEIKKVKQQALREARRRTGADKNQVRITQQEWSAIQSGAISTNMLKQILDNADMDEIKSLATPRTTRTLTDSKIARAKSLIAAGHTLAEVAELLGVSTSTISKAIK